jgi:hypothetical protein
MCMHIFSGCRHISYVHSHRQWEVHIGDVRAHRLRKTQCACTYSQCGVHITNNANKWGTSIDEVAGPVS